MTMHHPQLNQAQAEASRGWTETRVTVATALYNSGLSAAQVACLIGGVTRNAVIGKMHRDELASGERKAAVPLTTRTNGERRPRKTTHERGAVIDLRPPAPPKLAPPPASIVDAQIPLAQRRTFAQLDNACCHWPVGDPQSPDFFFCGAPKTNDAGIPYCRSHLLRSQHRDTGRGKAKGAAYANAGPGAAWRAR